MLALLLVYLGGLNRHLANPSHAATAPPTPAARIFCPRPVAEIGKVQAGSRIRVEYPVTNLADETVWVQIISGMVSTEAPRCFPIAPQSTRLIPFCYQFSARGIDGPFHRQLALIVVDPPVAPNCSLCGSPIAGHPHAASGTGCECHTPTTQPVITP